MATIASGSVLSNTVSRNVLSDNTNLILLTVRCMAITLIAVAVTIFLPGAIAWKDGVFNDKDVRARLSQKADHFQEAVQSLKTYENEKGRLEQSINALQTELDSINDKAQQQDFDFYFHLLEERHRELTSLQAPIFTLGFFLSQQMLLWPAIYASLGCLLFASPGWKRQVDLRFWRNLVALGLFIYFFYEWPLWTRNFLLGQRGRTVFAYTNFDIDPLSFFTQELTIMGFGFLLGAVWLRWTFLAEKVEIENARDSGPDYLNLRFVQRLQHSFYTWAFSSLALGLGFVYFTTFFWSLVAHYHDQRYIVSAFLAHSLWVTTWIFLSVPLAKNWLSLKQKRLKAIENLMTATESIPGKSEELNLEGLEKLESLAGIRISLAGVGAAVSLLLPIVQLFIHKG
jgi:nitrogen fixation-related uncharacterized protein